MLDRRITVFLIDDHELVRQGLRGMLERQGDMRVVGDCRTAHEALNMVARCCPDIVLVDVEAPAAEGIDLVRRLRRKDSGVTADVIALAETAACLPEAMAAGAAGYLLKDIGSKELAQAVREVYSGERSDGAAGNEAVDLVVTMPANSACILKFVHCVEKNLRASIVQTVGSWDQGTVVTIVPDNTPFEMLLPRLAALPGVLRAEEEKPDDTTMASLIKRIKGLRACRRRVLLSLDNHPAPQPGRRLKPAAA